LGGLFAGGVLGVLGDVAVGDAVGLLVLPPFFDKTPVVTGIFTLGIPKARMAMGLQSLFLEGWSLYWVRP
jgi:hypothetical protein